MGKVVIDERFKIDGVSMPKPSSYQTNPKILTGDAHRLIGNGRMVVPYVTTVWETTWHYKLIDGAMYDVIYNAYITATVNNKNMYHSLTTIDSNTGNSKTYQIYTQDDFAGHLYRVKPDGTREYDDVSFVFVGVGGEE